MPNDHAAKNPGRLIRAKTNRRRRKRRRRRRRKTTKEITVLPENPTVSKVTNVSEEHN